MMRETYRDVEGYLRYCDDEELVHRSIAYKRYESTRGKYPLPFSEYFVYHKNGNKIDNKPSNLAIVSKSDYLITYGTLNELEIVNEADYILVFAVFILTIMLITTVAVTLSRLIS